MPAIAALGAAFALLNYAFDEIGNPALRPQAGGFVSRPKSSGITGLRASLAPARWPTAPPTDCAALYRPRRSRLA